MFNLIIKNKNKNNEQLFEFCVRIFPLKNVAQAQTTEKKIE